MAPHVAGQRLAVYLALSKKPQGLTAQQLAVHSGIRPDSLRPRLIELEARGLVERTALTSRTLSGRLARVWRAVKVAPAVLDARLAEPSQREKTAASETDFAVIHRMLLRGDGSNDQVSTGPGLIRVRAENPMLGTASTVVIAFDSKGRFERVFVD